MARAKTIYALSTPTGRSAIAVLRLSGPECVPIAKKLAPSFQKIPRKAQCLDLYSADFLLLDKAIVLFFEAPFSFTGEDLLELHVHGSSSVINQLCTYFSQYPEVRPADPGEFTERAFYNEKLDLTQVEALSQLLASETEAQRKQAIRQLDGEFSRQISDWKEKLLNILAFLEAEIDFVDGEIPESNILEVNALTSSLLESMHSVLSSYHTGEKIRDGLHVAITGKPNVGKSSLLNKLVKRDAAIVSEIAGTTRDVIQVNLEIQGFPVVLYDTAGIRESVDKIEMLGVERAKTVIGASDLTIHVYDHPDEIPAEIPRDTFCVLNKIDLFGSVCLPDSILQISTTLGLGLETLTHKLAEFILKNYQNTSSLIVTNQRQHELVKNVCFSLEQSMEIDILELKCEHLRNALRDMGRLVGKIDIEEVLGAIFSSFCIGK